MLTIICQETIFTNIEAIIFDKDGTLENSQAYWLEMGKIRSHLIESQIPGISKSLLMAFGIYENILDPTGLMAVGSRHENEIAAAAYIAETGKSWFEAREIASNAFLEAERLMGNCVENSCLFPASLQVLQSLSKAGLKLAILSADSTVNVETFIKHHQLSKYVRLAMGSDRGLSKPDPELFLLACQNLEVKPSATLMVGDARGDIEMAKKAGAAGAIAIGWENNSIAHLKLADAIISQLQDIEIQLPHNFPVII
ncbi:MAG: HAD family hydrolase [Xenococcaceae cyanobacterium]